MAEAIGVVASGVGIAGFAGQTLESVLKLKQLWDDVRDVPEDIAMLLEEIELFTDQLTVIETHYQQILASSNSQPGLNRYLAFCGKIAKSLDDIVIDIRTLLRTRKRFATVKMVLKKETIAKYKSRLESAKTMLTLALQTLQMPHVAQIGSTHSLLITCTNQLSNLTQQLSAPTPSEALVGASTPTAVINEKSLTHPKRERPSYRRQAGRHHSREKTLISFRTPKFWTASLWELQFERACAGWRMSMTFTSYRIVTQDSNVLSWALAGYIDGLRRLFASGEASPYDRDEYGSTPLHMAAMYGRVDACRFLLEQGADINAMTFDRGFRSQTTPIRMLQG